MARFRPELLPDACDYYENELIGIKHGANKAKALCPFHKENSPSFFFWYEDGKFKCFGCTEGGSMVDFHMKRNGMDFVEAVKDLGAWK